MFRRPYFLLAKYAGIIDSSQRISLPIKLVSQYPTLCDKPQGVPEQSSQGHSLSTKTKQNTT